jgi:hypothetical protein
MFVVVNTLHHVEVVAKIEFVHNGCQVYFQ